MIRGQCLSERTDFLDNIVNFDSKQCWSLLTPRNFETSSSGLFVEHAPDIFD